MNQLVLLTIEFPYGKGENFLETEIKYLSEKFDTVFVIPSRNNNNSPRQLPKNCQILNDLSKLPNETFSFKSLLKFWNHTFIVYIYTLLFSAHRVKYIKYIGSLLHHLYNDISKLETLENLVEKKHLKDALFYDYWMLNDGISLAILKRQNKIQNLVCRAHGFDLYDNVHVEGVIPFREYKIKYFQKIYCISKHGQNYLKSQINPNHAKNKVLKSYLGVPNPNQILGSSQNKLPQIVSCSSMTDNKSVDLIAKSISKMKTDCQWIHFGDGVNMETVAKLVAEFPSHISVHLKGHVPNSQLLDYYKKNSIDIFISMSRSEGLPVSMMEAQSYGIPIVAPHVNGIPEIVNHKTGILIGDRTRTEEVAKILDDILSGKILFSKDEARQHYLDNFNADRNYTAFANDLLKHTVAKNE